MNIGELFVRLTADPSGVNRGVDQATRKFNGLNSTVAKLGATIAGVFAAERIAAFGADSIRTFVEAEAIWNRLAGTLRAAGVEFANVRPEIEAAARAMQDTTAIGDEDFATILQTLVGTTADYARSLREVQTVADFAAGTQMDLHAAAILVGKAMVGETGTLSRYGIIVQEGADAMEVLRQRFRGLAQNETKTLEGALLQLNNEWGDLKEAIGGALVGGDNAVETIGNLTDELQGLAEWVAENRDLFDGLRQGIGRFVRDAVQDVQDIIAVFERLEDAWQGLVDAVNSPLFASGLVSETGTVQLAANVQGAATGATQFSRAMAGALATGHQVAAVVKLTDEQIKKAAEEAKRLALVWAQLADLGPAQLAGVETTTTVRLASGQTVEIAGLKDAAERIARLAETTAALDLTMKEVQLPAPASTSPSGGLGSAITGSLSNFASQAGSQIMAVVAQFGPLAAVAAALRPVFEGLMDTIGPVLSTLAEPLRIVGQLLGSVIAPILKLLAPPLRLLATIASYVVEALGTLVRAIGKAVDALPFVSARGVIRAGEQMIQSARDSREALDAASSGMENLADVTNRVATAMSNVPQIFDLALRRRQAMLSGGGVTSGGGSTGGDVVRPGARPPVVVNINNPGPGTDGRRLARDFTRAVSDELRKGGSSELRVALLGAA